MPLQIQSILAGDCAASVFGNTPLMIVHLATKRGIKAVTKHLGYRPALNKRVRAITYEGVLQRSEWPRGVYLFTDAERMTTAQKGYAAWLHDRMSDRPDAFKLLNHPTKHVARYKLLKQLCSEGRNGFDVHRANGLGTHVRYPLFLRYEDRHIGSLTPLLHTPLQTDEWLARLAAMGEDLDRVIAVEFIDTADHENLYRKYGAFRVGDKIVPRHMFASTHWEVKIDTNNRSAFRRREEYAYLRENPHQEQVMQAFESAGLQYGRIDYAMKDGRIQVWEVNDNPQISSSLVRYWRGRLGRCLLCLRNLDHAFSLVEAQVEAGPPVRFDATEHCVWEALCAQ